MALTDFLSSFGLGGNTLSDIGESLRLSEAPSFSTMNYVPPAAAPAASSGGWWDSLKSFLAPVGEGVQAAGNFAKTVSPLVNIATGAMGIYGGVKGAQQLAEQTQIAKQAQQTQQQMAQGAAGAAAPLVNYGQEQLAQVQAGKLPESIEAEIALWIQGAKQRARDFYARIGQGDSDTLRTMEDLIDQRAISMRASALQDQARLGIGSLSSGAGAYGAGGGIAGSAATSATAQGASIEELIRAANEQMAALSGGAA